MMLKVLGSGSSGNCYLLEDETEALIIEAGVSFKEVKISLDFNISKIVGVVVSHIHQDHNKAVLDYVHAGIPVFKPYESETERQITKYGSFTVKSFPLVHNVPCYGFLISQKKIGRLLYVSDTQYVKWRFKNLNHILVEANYSKELLTPANEESVKRNHVLEGHMEIGTTCEFLKANRTPELMNVVLLHLSEYNADPVIFRYQVRNTVQCPTYIARKGLRVNLNLCPF